MVSSVHEIVVEMIRNRPSLVAELLDGVFALDLPAYGSVRVDSGDLPDIAPTEYRADVVVVLADGDRDAAAVVVEVQLGRDADKRLTWPVYLATLRARLRCPTLLMVVCVDPAVAGWCATPIELGHPGFTLAPLVLGPDRVPMVVERVEAGRRPELAVLSAMAHGGGADRIAVLDALRAALDAVDEQHAVLYLDVVLGALPAAARSYLEALVDLDTYEYQSDFVRNLVRRRAESIAKAQAEGRAEGRAKGVAEGRAKGVAEGRAKGVAEGRAKGVAEGKATSVLAVLDARGIDLPDAARGRITDCSDLEQLDVWMRRAVTAASIRDLFA